MTAAPRSICGHESAPGEFCELAPGHAEPHGHGSRVGPPKERPILFSAPMIRALLEGRKTQTRRVVRQASESTTRIFFAKNAEMVPRGKYTGWVHECDAPFVLPLKCPFGEPGDRLWVREAWARRLDEDHIAPRDLKDHWAWYWADPQTCNTGCAGAAGKLRPSIHMPRWASRISLEVTGVRVDRLKYISDEDATAEGCPAGRVGSAKFTARDVFAIAWDQINGDGAWDANPWVWVVSFRRVNG